MKNLEKVWRNSDIHSLNTTHKYDCHIPNFSLTDYRKEVYYTYFKLFGNLPSTNKRLNNWVKLLKPAVQEDLLSHCCYHVDRFTSTENSCTVYEDT